MKKPSYPFYEFHQIEFIYTARRQREEWSVVPQTDAWHSAKRSKKCVEGVGGLDERCYRHDLRSGFDLPQLGGGLKGKHNFYLTT